MMNSYLARLNPAERRFVVVVGLLFFIVVNVFWVWPHFADWGNFKDRLAAARGKLDRYQTAIARIPDLQAKIRALANEGQQVPPEDAMTQFQRTIVNQSAQSGVGFIGSSRAFTSTNQFFIEQSLNVQVVGGEKQLVDFLYRLSSGNSLIRVREIVVAPDPPRHQLNATITFVASYQKNPGAPARSGRAASASPQPASTVASSAPPKR